MSATTPTTRKLFGMSAGTFPFVLGLVSGAVVFGVIMLFRAFAG